MKYLFKTLLTLYISQFCCFLVICENSEVSQGSSRHLSSIWSWLWGEYWGSGGWEDICWWLLLVKFQWSSRISRLSSLSSVSRLRKDSKEARGAWRNLWGFRIIDCLKHKESIHHNCPAAASNDLIIKTCNKSLATLVTELIFAQKWGTTSKM